MEREPTEAELREFVGAMLANLDRSVREPDVIDEALRAHHEMWILLYRASSGLDESSAAP